MNLSAWIKQHKNATLTLVVLLSISGLVAALKLPVALFPQVDFPRVVVSLDAGDRPAERMAMEVTVPVEETIRSVPGLKSIRSTTSRGSSEISINFDWGANMVESMLQVESAINQALPTLPQGTQFDVRRMDPTVFPCLAYSLTSDKVPLVKQRDFAYYELRPLLSTVPGVAKVVVQGGQQAEYQVIVDPAKLEAHGLTLADLSKALSSANTISAVGRLEDHNKLYLALVDNRFSGSEEIGQTVVLKTSTGLVRVSDLAEVSLGAVPLWTRVTADGHDAVILQVFQQPSGNTVELSLIHI